MPIPPRPIHNHHAHQRRPVARRPDINFAAGGQSLINECRADVSIVPRGASAPNTLSGVFVRPHSFSPMHTPLSRSPMHSPLAGSPLRAASPASPPRIEVPLSQLMDGRGRPKRTGAAAALGFDFVPKPTAVPLEEDRPSAPQPAEPRSSFWAWRERFQAAPGAEPADSTPHDTQRETSPDTPALEPHVLEEEDDDWEHVDVDDDDEVVGELELDVELDAQLAPAPKDATATTNDTSYKATAPTQ